MKIAVCSDEVYPVNDFVVQELRNLGHETILFGALKTRQPESWIHAAESAALAVSQGQCDEGIFFCWTGTGVTIVANKVLRIRAALCTDAPTAAGARTWNRANILTLSNRLVTNDLAKEILTAWFNTPITDTDNSTLAEIHAIEQKMRIPADHF